MRGTGGVGWGEGRGESEGYWRGGVGADEEVNQREIQIWCMNEKGFTLKPNSHQTIKPTDGHRRPPTATDGHRQPPILKSVRINRLV